MFKWLTFSHEIVRNGIEKCDQIRYDTIRWSPEDGQSKISNALHKHHFTPFHLIWLRILDTEHWHKPTVMHMKSYFHININTLGFALHPYIRNEVQVQTSIWHLTCVVGALSSFVYRLTCIPCSYHFLWLTFGVTNVRRGCAMVYVCAMCVYACVGSMQLFSQN